ncbi:hypothetical protein K9M59_03575 [Candidatus Gracilibacteria bacterium]|nr:hypothetical protein [Candidatus Gracilibacteria bacterium]MCF7819404.1 hypothetical protein [Candidatus Gracilibacteria bacterium]
MKTKQKQSQAPRSVKNKAVSTQQYLQFAGVRDDTLILKNGGIRAVFEVSSINFSLKSEDEQNAIINSYQKFLNSLHFPTQILIRSRKLDIDNYIEDLKRRMKSLSNDLLKNQMAEYIEYIQKLVEYSDIMEKRFFVVVPANPPRAEKKSLFSKFLAYIRPEDTVLNIITRRKEFKQLKKELDSRCHGVQTALENCSLSIKRLSTKEIIELFYQVYNPQLARTQKMAPLEELSVAEGPEEYLVSDEN